MMDHNCKFCEGPPTERTLVRTPEDVRLFLECHDRRWPPLATRLRGIIVGLDRMAREIR